MIDGGLKGEHRSAIIDTIAANDRVERAVLFGSRAMGTNTVTSDVDIALYGDSLTLTDQARLAEAIDDIPMAQSVELVLYDSIDNPAFRDHVRTHGVEWYRRAKAGRLHLLPKHRRVLEALLRQHLPDVEVWAYGSRVNGRSHDASDLDLVLRAPGLKKIPDGRLRDLEEAVRELSIPLLVEVRDWARLPERFQREIQREHVVLVGSEPWCEIPDWREAALGDVVELLSGGTPSKGQPAYWNGSIPWVSAKDMKRFRLRDTADHVTADGLANGTKKVPAGSVLLLTRGMTLLNEMPVCVAERPMAFNQDIKALRPKPCIEPSFLPYLLLGNKRRLLSLVDLAGHGTGRINTDELKSLDVRLPPSSEQRAIAHVLETLDGKIELNRCMNETLEATARALFKSWFVDFDPVRAKTQGRDTGLPEDIAALFPDRLVDSELGEMPEGWQLGTLNDIAFLNPESWSAKHSPEKVVYVDLANTKWGYIESVQTFPWDEAPSRARRVLRKGDTVIATVRPGNGSFALIGEAGLTGSTGFAVLRPREATDRGLVWCAATSSGNIDRLALLADGGAYPAIRPDEIGSTPVPVADSDIRLAFSRLVDPLLDKSNGNKHASRELANLRDTLLPRLISGEIRLRDAEQVVGTVS